jgi:hypothetical protein
MSSRIVQFHAAPSDLPALLDLLRHAVPGVGLHTWSPAPGLQPLVGASPGDAVDWLVASVVPLAHGSVKMSALLDAHPGVLLIEPPRMRDGALREIAVSARDDEEREPEQLKAWGRFIRRLRKTFTSGAFLGDTVSGGGRYYKTAHAMQGALALQDEGIVLLAAAGHVRYDFRAPAP